MYWDEFQGPRAVCVNMKTNQLAVDRKSLEMRQLTQSERNPSCLRSISYPQRLSSAEAIGIKLKKPMAQQEMKSLTSPFLMRKSIPMGCIVGGKGHLLCANSRRLIPIAHMSTPKE